MSLNFVAVDALFVSESPENMEEYLAAGRGGLRTQADCAEPGFSYPLEMQKDSSSGVPPRVSPSRVVMGVLFIIVWLLAALAWGALASMGVLMANDSGAASNASHERLILTVIGGQLIFGAAGIPGGLAFFWRDKRRMLIVAFICLLTIGTLGQIWAVLSFAAS